MKLSESRTVIVEKNISTGNTLGKMRPCPYNVVIYAIENKIKAEKKFGRENNEGYMSISFQNRFLTISVKKILIENGYIISKPKPECAFDDYSYIAWKNI